MSLFTLSISNFAPALTRQDQELERIHKYLLVAVQDVRSAGGKKSSGNITDNIGGVPTTVGSWTFTSQIS
jgi:hypothetical protein